MALRIGVFVFFLGLGACTFQPPEPEPAVLPEITMEGLNTFGCTVGGEIYQARGRWTPPVEAIVSNWDLFLRTWDRTNDEYIHLTIQFDDSPWTYSPGKYYVKGNSFGILPNDIVVHDPNLTVRGRSVSYDSAYLEILYIDEASRIISGTFQFDAETVDGDTVQIRKGRFDVTAG